MINGILTVPSADNEPVLPFAPGDPEREELKAKLAELSGSEIEIPLIIGGKEVRTGKTVQAVMPHDHGHVLATWHQAGRKEVTAAIDAALAAHEEWAAFPWQERVGVFLRAAELLATTWRSTINASTMLAQSKTCHQAEIDAACELIDFLRFNAEFAERLYEDQPISGEGVWNATDYRPLEGFVYAISPFNFTSIALNLAAAPALMGNTAIWKPSNSAVYSNYFLQKLMEEAGMPPGVINFIPGDPVEISDVALNHPDLAGIHFTGSTTVFRSLWKSVGERLDSYRTYPRLVGETGGKDFIVAHSSADPDALRTAIVRGSFEYQGQKCSAVSRVYIPESLWEQMGDDLVAETEAIAMGDPADFGNFLGAVIHREAYDKIMRYIDGAKSSNDAEVIAGGEGDDSTGYFIRPTIIRAKRPDYVTMCEEIFGPVVSVYVYPDAEWEEALTLVDETSPYGLTGAVFARNRTVVQGALSKLRFAAGNFYVNDKPTGAVVGQQPFGGSRASGTNDKAGSILNLTRWVSARSIKETFVPATDYRYPFMDGE
ncbi:MAG: L-glutamate gamma-semialdehyde dehydrogenase [Gemmatimonadota bacterium]